MNNRECRDDKADKSYLFPISVAGIVTVFALAGSLSSYYKGNNQLNISQSEPISLSDFSSTINHLQP